MQKSFRFTNSSIKALPANTDTRSTELEVSDTEVIGLKCLSGRTGNKRSSCATHSTVPKKVSVLADSLKLMWGQLAR